MSIPDSHALAWYTARRGDVPIGDELGETPTPGPDSHRWRGSRNGRIGRGPGPFDARCYLARVALRGGLVDGQGVAHDPGAYWAEPVLPSQLEEMRDKYAALERLVLLGEGEARKRALRGVSRRWPGALREAELVCPDELRHRMELALDLRAGAPRVEYRDAGAAAVVLWADLHELLGDQLDARRRRRATANAAGSTRLDTRSFVEGLPPRARARWPDPAWLVAECGPVVRPRQAYLWLAVRCGHSLPALHRELFGREGHWDRREGDPAWAHPERSGRHVEGSDLAAPGDDEP